MKERYFTNHYSHVGNIDPNSDLSIKNWLQRTIQGNEMEIGPYLTGIPDAKILELGCGIGGTMHYLLSKGAKDIIGVDHSEDQLAICKKFVTPNVVQSDVIEFLKTTNQQYDYIIALDLIEHLPKDKIILFCTLLFERLKEGGIVILRTPNMGSIFGLRSRYIDFTHEVGFTEESIGQVMRNSKFTNIQIFNSYIGRKRLFAVKLLQHFLEKLYNYKLSSIVTQNLIIKVRK